MDVKSGVEMTHFKSEAFFTDTYRTHPESTTLLRTFLYLFASSVNFSDDFMEQRMLSKVTEIYRYLCLHIEGTSDSKTTS